MFRKVGRAGVTCVNCGLQADAVIRMKYEFGRACAVLVATSPRGKDVAPSAIACRRKQGAP